MPHVRIARRIALRLLAGIALLCAGPALAQSEPAGSEPRKRIGIVGAGKIGGTLGALWAKAGYEVFLSSRHPDALGPLVASLGEKARAGTPAEAIAFGDAVLIAVPYKAYPEIGREHAGALKGKVVIDAGNAVKAREPELHEEAMVNGIGETSARYLPGARLVRAFNAANYRLFEANAHRAGERMAIPIAGDDPTALETARRLVSDAGFDPVVVGELAAASKFAMGSEGFGHVLSAPELKRKLGLTP